MQSAGRAIVCVGAWAAAYVERGMICMAESRGAAGAKVGGGGTAGPCLPGLGLCPPPQGPWRLLTWPCDSPLRRRSPTQSYHRRESPARPRVPGRPSRWSLRTRRRRGWPRGPLSSPDLAPPRQSRHPTWTGVPALRAPPQGVRTSCQTATMRPVTPGRQVGRWMGSRG